MEEKYDILKNLGLGILEWQGWLKIRRQELFAVKYIERGKKIDKNVQREISNHSSLRHPNIVRFKEVLLTLTHLAIVMEYAAGGELFGRICSAGRFSEDEARFFFQQLISGVNYCHSMEICHRDLKLKNTWMEVQLHALKYVILVIQRNSSVHCPGSSVTEGYDGKIADVWSCGVTLYVMLVGAYPCEDPEDPTNFSQTTGMSSYTKIKTLQSD